MIKIFEEETYQGRGFTHLDNHGDKLISGSSSGEVIAWDFQTGSHLHSIQSDIQIMVPITYFFDGRSPSSTPQK